jgi:uncharacterized protein (TIGR02271 family)
MNVGKTAKTIGAYFRDPADAERAISQLSTAGVPKTDIGVAIWDRDAGDQAESTKSGLARRLQSLFAPHERDEYDSGDTIDVLDHMGIPEDEARHYKNALRSGGVLVTVQSDNRLDEARRILDRAGAVSVDRLKSERIGEREMRDIGSQRIQLLGEALRVHKERIERGAVTLKKDVVSERQSVEVPTTREEVFIERHPVEGRATSEVGFEEGKEVRIPVSEERVNVEKRPVVREEVEVGKRQVQDTKRVSSDVKHEELRVEKEGDTHIEEKKRKRA